MKNFWKRSIIVILCIMMLFFFASCYSGSEQKEVIAMFDSFDKSQDIVLLTCFQLIINGERYDHSEIQYNDKQSHILYLEEDGFYSYAYNEETLEVEFLFTLYEGFEVTSLGTTVLMSEIINDFFADGRFWFRILDPRTEDDDQVYFTWNVETKQEEIVDDVPREYEYAIDENRTKNYTVSRKRPVIYSDSLEITDNKTGVTKTINGKILTQFEEGRQIKDINKTTIFNIDKVFEKDGDLYFASYFEVGFWGFPCYYYIIKWNFETEESEFYTAFFFEEYQEWIDDMYIK